MKAISKIKALIVIITVGFVISLSGCMTYPAATTVVVAPRPRPMMMRPRPVVVVTPGYMPGMYRPYGHCHRRW